MWSPSAPVSARLTGPQRRSSAAGRASMPTINVRRKGDPTPRGADLKIFWRVRAHTGCRGKPE